MESTALAGEITQLFEAPERFAVGHRLRVEAQRTDSVEGSLVFRFQGGRQRGCRLADVVLFFRVRAEVEQLLPASLVGDPFPALAAQRALREAPERIGVLKGSFMMSAQNPSPL